MRKPVVIIIALLLALTISHVNADGLFIIEKSKNSDPKSHARDITEPIQKALIHYDKGMESLVLQVSYKGSASKFAWLVPTPSKPEVFKVDTPVFHRLHNSTAPRIRYWFDADQKLGGYYGARKLMTQGLNVQVFEEKQLGAYDIAVLRAGKAEDLLQWLRSNGYQITPKLTPVISDYIRRGWVFTAMRINAGYWDKASERLHEGVLQSLKFSFRAPEPVYPLKISSLNKGRTKILLYVVGRQRYDEPLLKTECSIDYYQVFSQFPVDYAPSKRLTKLTAELSPEQMTHDLVLKPAATNDILPVKDVSPPFLENLGASFLLLIRNVMPYPNSLAVLGCVVLIALSPFGRKRWRMWIAAGVVFIIASVPPYSNVFMMITAGRSGKNGGFTSAGIWALVIIGIVLGSITISIIRNIRRRHI